MAPFDAARFVREHGVVLATARGPVPTLAHAITGAPIRGSWWSHPRSHDIFRALSSLADDDDVKFFKLIAGKVTIAHRRVWPALVRLADQLGRDRLAEIRQEHTESGAHRNLVTPFPTWVPADVARLARALAAEDARATLGDWVR